MAYNDENISSNFGMSGVDIEPSISKSFDSFSGIDIENPFSYLHTKQNLINSNKDGRIPLGIFDFKELNPLRDEFPGGPKSNIFNQIAKENLVPNGDGRFVQSFWFNDYSNTGDAAFFIPDGGWGYCTYDGVGQRDRADDMYGPFMSFPEDMGADGGGDLPGGQNFIDSFQQSAGTPNDNQNIVGYAGYYPYHSIMEVGKKFREAQVSASAGDECNYFFNLLVNEQTIFPSVCSIDRIDSNSGMGTKFPNVAKWVTTQAAASHGRCLQFEAGSFSLGQYDLDDNGQNDDDASGVSWNGWSSGDSWVQNIANNHYRTLNQVIRLYNTFIDGSRKTGVNELKPYTVMEVKFKMRTINGSINNMPNVEVSIINADGSVGRPDRFRDVDNQRGYPKNFYHFPHGSFNSITYDGDLNTPNTLDKRYSHYGGSRTFANTQKNQWETFSYKFSLDKRYLYSNGYVRDLWLMVQTGNTFSDGCRVLLDDFEVYESHDFVPEVDVRKRISVGNYGSGSLTEYYDPILQPKEYKDTQAPLEAQFYFYPTYPTENYFDVKKTPMYEEFKKGFFYIYDVDWGDGSPKEFTTEPQQIGEDVVLLHTYETSGVFEVTGTMIKLKGGEVDNDSTTPFGVISNKRFSLNINVNEGKDEDFEYFGSDGYSFIPYKNSLPIIGGSSNQSIYYKTIKRQLGFIGEIERSSIINEAINYTPKPSDIGLEDYLPGGPIIFDTDGDGVPDQTFAIGLAADDATAIKYVELMGEQDGFEGQLASYTSGFQILYNYRWNENGDRFDIVTAGSLDDFEFGDQNKPITSLQAIKQTEIFEIYKTNVGFKSAGDKLKTELALLKMDTSVADNFDVLPFYEKQRYLYRTGEFDTDNLFHTDPITWPGPDLPIAADTIPTDIYRIERSDGVVAAFTTTPPPGSDGWVGNLVNDGLEEGRTYSFELTNGSSITWDLLPPTPPNPLIYNGIETFPEELGQSIGDVDLTNIKYYNSPKPLWEILGFDTNLAGTPSHERYWKNIIPEDYSIFNREGIDLSNDLVVNIYSEQDWLDDYYYPVLPRYGADGQFIEGDFPNDKIPFPQEAPITTEVEKDSNILINITTEAVDKNVLNDFSGTQNFGFYFSDFRPMFDGETLQPKKNKTLINRLKIGTTGGAF